MARTERERERLKEWALTWCPQPTHDRLNRYRKIMFANCNDYRKGRVVLSLTPAERKKAESIYYYLLEKHKWKVQARPGYYRILWACAVSRCRKNLPYRFERLGIINKLTYWHDRAHNEGVARLGIPSLGKRRKETFSAGGDFAVIERNAAGGAFAAKSREIDGLLDALEKLS